MSTEKAHPAWTLGRPAEMLSGASVVGAAVVGAAVVTVLHSAPFFQIDSSVVAEDTTPGTLPRAAHAAPVGLVQQLRSFAVSYSVGGIPWWHSPNTYSFSTLDPSHSRLPAYWS